jgi:tRNA(Ile)-lysidine synthase
MNYLIPLYVETTDAKSFAAENGCAIQEAARILRYRWFNEILKADPILKYLCTAHHADDNIETVLMNLFRGTGIAGLKGILAKQENIIRPLLFAHRREIEVYAKENDIDFVEDSSNKEEKYTRNFFRLQVIPMVEKIYPAAAENMRQNIERFTGWNNFIVRAWNTKRKNS